MPILDSKSEAFLDFIRGLQKGKGKTGASPDNPLHFSGQAFSAEDWKTPTTVTKDFETASIPAAAPSANDFAPVVEEPTIDPIDDRPRFEEETGAGPSENVGAADPASAEQAATNGFASTVETPTVGWDDVPFKSDTKTTDDNTQAFSYPLTTEAEPTATHSVSANNYATTCTDPTISELQITTRSMTTSGAATTQAETTSAATEKPASSRLPSPAPAAPSSTTQRASAWPSTPLLSNGSDFLKAAEAFKPRMRGGEEERVKVEEGTAAASFLDNGTAAANGNGEAKQAAPAQPFSFREYPLPNPELPSSSIKSMPVNQPHPPSAKQPEHSPTASHPASQSDRTTPQVIKSTNGRHPRTLKYSPADLSRIGMQKKQHLFNNLVAMQGKGRVRVNILPEI
ncbi:MAG: hypothetical protein L6R39_007688 [Caloplaca ligustica]|nr:MAG: hypothetical protein L6R39_007688 [Caloplaca ligustica]